MAKHYNDAVERRGDVAPHRDCLMLRHNNIKRSVISLAATCFREARACRSTADIVSAFLADGSPPRGTGRRKRRRARDLRVLDVGSGKGGDLHKWNHEGTAVYDGVDISEPRCAEAESRAAGLRGVSDWEGSMRASFAASTAAAFLAATGKAGRIWDVISMQFVLHYLVDDEESLRVILRHCADSLVAGGVLVGTVVNSDEVVPILSRRDDEPPPFDPDYCRVQPIANQGSKPPASAGYRYEFSLRNCVDGCIEHVIPRATLEREASRCGLVVDYFASFTHPAFQGDSIHLHQDQMGVTRLYAAFQMTKQS